MKRILFLRPLLLVAISIIASLSVVALNPALVHADSVSDGLNQLKNDTGNAYPTSVAGDKLTPSQILGKIIEISLGIAFAIAVIMVIYGGFQYITSAGNEEKATSARKTLLYAGIGLVIILLSFVMVSTLLNFVTKGGTGGTSGGSSGSNAPVKPPTRTPPVPTPPPPGNDTI
jgi:hypothetical protein